MPVFYILLMLAACLLGGCAEKADGKVGAEQQTEVVVPFEASSLVIDTSFTLDYLMGHFDPSTHPDFELIAVSYADRAGLYLHKETYAAFEKMYAAAAEDGVQLVIRSATRNFDYQKGIWEGKWTGSRQVEGQNLAKTISDPKQRALKILEQSSMPGSSRHHWGTDIDLNAFNNSYFEKGKGKKEYDWLVANAPRFGFCQPYTAKGEDRPFGYEEERWHWSYLPLSRQLTALARRDMKDDMIKGFEGAETAVAIEIVNKYVLGIGEGCRE